MTARGQDAWAEAAKRFYDRGASLKQTEAYFSAFRRAYQPLTNRITGLSGATALDAGCGPGYLSAILRSVCASVTGLDLSRRSLLEARRRNPGRAFLEADMTQLPLRREQFDVAFAITSLEFCCDKKKALEELRRVLVPGGRLYLEVRNADFALFRLPPRLIRLCTRLGLIRPYEASSFRDLNPAEWKALLRDSGFTVKKVSSSLRPWNYGPPVTRLKNLIIRGCRTLLPPERQYMIAFLAVRD